MQSIGETKDTASGLVAGRTFQLITNETYVGLIQERAAGEDFGHRDGQPGFSSAKP